jgi:hypothetical protein
MKGMNGPTASQIPESLSPQEIERRLQKLDEEARALRTLLRAVRRPQRGRNQGDQCEGGAVVIQTKLTPPQVAKLWGVSPEKVIGFIRRGELRAVNLASRLGGRPRYRIDPRDMEAFERARTAIPKLSPRKRKAPPPEFIEYY